MANTTRIITTITATALCAAMLAGCTRTQEVHTDYGDEADGELV